MVIYSIAFPITYDRKKYNRSWIDLNKRGIFYKDQIDLNKCRMFYRDQIELNKWGIFYIDQMKQNWKDATQKQRQKNTHHLQEGYLCRHHPESRNQNPASQ